MNRGKVLNIHLNMYSQTKNITETGVFVIHNEFSNVVS
jgi:hypothetical protein